MEEKEKISVLMSVYKNDNPEWFKMAIDSVCNQTLIPDEVLIIIDGPVSDEIKQVIKDKEEEFTFIRHYQIEQNVGTGRALEIGLPMCKNELIARMDSDDISKPDRFEKQVKFLIENNLDVVGSDISEFCNSPDEVVSIREVPKKEEDIKKYIKSRTPFNHVSVLMKKSKVLESGNYQHMHYCEDYYLWCRMLLVGAKMGNMDEILVNVRMNEATFKRRGGLKYYKSQKKLFKFMKEKKIINWLEYVKTLSTRFIVHVLMPGKLKEKIYKKHLRKNTNGKNITEVKSA